MCLNLIPVLSVYIDTSAYDYTISSGLESGTPVELPDIVSGSDTTHKHMAVASLTDSRAIICNVEEPLGHAVCRLRSGDNTFSNSSKALQLSGTGDNLVQNIEITRISSVSALACWVHNYTMISCTEVGIEAEDFRLLGNRTVVDNGTVIEGDDTSSLRTTIALTSTSKATAVLCSSNNRNLTGAGNSIECQTLLKDTIPSHGIYGWKALLLRNATNITVTVPTGDNYTAAQPSKCSDGTSGGTEQACTGATGNVYVAPTCTQPDGNKSPIPDATSDSNTCKNLTGNVYKAGIPSICTNGGDNSSQIACEGLDNGNEFEAAYCSNGGDASSEGSCKGITGYKYTPATCTRPDGAESSIGDSSSREACEGIDNNNTFVAATCSDGGDASSAEACRGPAYTGHTYTMATYASCDNDLSSGVRNGSREECEERDEIRTIVSWPRAPVALLAENGFGMENLVILTMRSHSHTPNPELVTSVKHTPAIVVGCFPKSLSSNHDTYSLTCRALSSFANGTTITVSGSSELGPMAGPREALQSAEEVEKTAPILLDATKMTNSSILLCYKDVSSELQKPVSHIKCDLLSVQYTTVVVEDAICEVKLGGSNANCGTANQDEETCLGKSKGSCVVKELGSNDECKAASDLETCDAATVSGNDGDAINDCVFTPAADDTCVFTREIQNIPAVDLAWGNAEFKLSHPLSKHCVDYSGSTPGAFDPSVAAISPALAIACFTQATYESEPPNRSILCMALAVNTSSSQKTAILHLTDDEGIVSTTEIKHAQNQPSRLHDLRPQVHAWQSKFSIGTTSNSSFICHESDGSIPAATNSLICTTLELNAKEKLLSSSVLPVCTDGYRSASTGCNRGPNQVFVHPPLPVSSGDPARAGSKNDIWFTGKLMKNRQIVEGSSRRRLSESEISTVTISDFMVPENTDACSFKLIDTEFEGEDIAPSGPRNVVGTKELCCASCAATSGCTAWSFDKSKGTCSVKDGGSNKDCEAANNDEANCLGKSKGTCTVKDGGVNNDCDAANDLESCNTATNSGNGGIVENDCVFTISQDDACEYAPSSTFGQCWLKRNEGNQVSTPGKFDSGTMLSSAQGAIIVSVCGTFPEDSDSIGEVRWLDSKGTSEPLQFNRSARLGLGESPQGEIRALSVWYLAGDSKFVGTRGNITISTSSGMARLLASLLAIAFLWASSSIRLCFISSST